MAFNFIVQVAIAFVGLALSIALTPRPKSEAAQPQEIDRPEVEEGSPLPVIFGTVDIRRYQVAFFGDKRSVAVRKKGGKK